MKQLFWKEWYELRLLPLGAALFVSLLLIIVRLTNPFGASGTLYAVHCTLPGTWLLVGMMAGAGLFAQELGTHTLQFLSSLPTSRARIWLVKVVTATGVVLLSVLTSTIAWAILCSPIVDSLSRHSMTLQNSFLNSHDISVSLLGAICCLTAAFAVSPFFDRPFPAMLAAFITSSVAYYIALTIGFHFAFQGALLHGHNPERCFRIAFGLCIPAFVAISYWTFTRGESLRTTRRFVVGGVAGTAALAICSLIFGLGYSFHAW